MGWLLGVMNTEHSLCSASQQQHAIHTFSRGIIMWEVSTLQLPDHESGAQFIRPNTFNDLFLDFFLLLLTVCLGKKPLKGIWLRRPFKQHRCVICEVERLKDLTWIAHLFSLVKQQTRWFNSLGNASLQCITTAPNDWPSWVNLPNARITLPPSVNSLLKGYQ